MASAATIGPNKEVFRRKIIGRVLQNQHGSRLRSRRALRDRVLVTFIGC
jgi:hypothetical protein